MQYKFRYREWDIAVDLSSLVGEIYIDNGFHSELLYEGAEIFNTIDFFENLDILIEKFESRINAPTVSAIDSDRDDIPF